MKLSTDLRLLGNYSSRQYGDTNRNTSSRQYGDTNRTASSRQHGETNRNTPSRQYDDTNRTASSRQYGDTNRNTSIRQYGDTNRNTSSRQYGDTNRTITSRQYGDMNRTTSWRQNDDTGRTASWGQNGTTNRTTLWRQNDDADKTTLNTEMIGYYSLNSNREYSGDLSQLKYINKDNMNPRKVKFDLNKDIENRNERILKGNDCLRKDFVEFLKLNRNEINVFSKEPITLKETPFVFYRGTFRDLLLLPYETFYSRRIIATLVNGVIYITTVNDESRSASSSAKYEIMGAWGYKFEQYLLSDTPFGEPDLSAPCDENPDCCLVYKGTLGDHTIVYGSEIDAIIVDEDTSEIDEDWNIKKKDNSSREECIAYLKKHKIVGCALSGIPRSDKARLYKYLKWWIVNFLVGGEKTVCGFRDDEGIVTEIVNFTQHDLVKENVVSAIHRTLQSLQKEVGDLFFSENGASKQTIYFYVINFLTQLDVGNWILSMHSANIKMDASNVVSMELQQMMSFQFENTRIKWNKDKCLMFTGKLLTFIKEALMARLKKQGYFVGENGNVRSCPPTSIVMNRKPNNPVIVDEEEDKCCIEDWFLHELCDEQDEI